MILSHSSEFSFIGGINSTLGSESGGLGAGKARSVGADLILQEAIAM